MVRAWYDETIGKIRFTADPGGEALGVSQAEERVSQLQDAIEQAKNE